MESVEGTDNVVVTAGSVPLTDGVLSVQEKKRMRVAVKKRRFFIVIND